MHSIAVNKTCLCAILSVGLFLLAVFAEQSQADDSLRRSKRQDLSVGMSGEDYPQDDRELLQQIFRTPIKRQWCRTGMAYNPVLGTCIPSLATIRGRDRDFRV